MNAPEQRFRSFSVTRRALRAATVSVFLTVGLCCGQKSPRSIKSRLSVATSFAMQAAGGATRSRAFTEAQAALDRGDLAAALADTERGLRGAPHSVTGLNLLGIILARQGDSERALEAFRAALAANPQSVETHNNLGLFYVALKKPGLAETEFRAALKAAPRDRTANYNLGAVLLARGQAGGAIACLRRIQPPDADTLFNLTQAYFDAGKTEEGLTTAKRLSAESANDVRVHFSLGVLLAAKKQYEAAEHELEAADALRPGTFEILYNLGEAYLRDGKAAKAELTLGRAAKLQPDSADTLYLLAQAESDQGNDVNALNLLVRAHRVAPKNTRVIFLMARLSMKQSYYEDAIPLLEDGLAISPASPDLHAALGECYFITGKIDKAIQEFQTLVKLDPKARSYAFMGLCYRHLGRFDEAKKYFELGLQDDPHNAECLYNMGYIASRQGHYLEAEKWLNGALRSNPNYADALLEIAGVKIDEKEYAQAIPLLRKAATLDPHPGPIYYKLAMAERNLHQLDAAERDLKVFSTFSKDADIGPYPYQHLFDFLDQRAALRPQQQTELDLAQLLEEVKLHPDRPDDLYLLAQDYLKVGRTDDARKTLAQLDQVSRGDFRTLAGIGVLLARYRFYQDAVAYFGRAVQANPNSDDAWYDLADAYFRSRRYSDALSAIERISPSAPKDTSYTFLLGDIYAHLGRNQQAVNLFRQVVASNPDQDRPYLSLALACLRSGDVGGAHAALEQGLSRVPNSGELFWGMGILSALEDEPQRAEQYLKKSVDLLPEWPAAYSALGVLYYQTGRIDEARRTLEEFTENGPRGALNVERIEQALNAAASRNSGEPQTGAVSLQARQQFLQIALALADQSP